MGMRRGMIAAVLGLAVLSATTAGAAEEQGATTSEAKLVTVPAPTPGSVPTDLPASVEELLAQGWRITQVQAIGGGASVLLVLERHPTPSLSFQGAPLAEGDGMPNLPFFIPPAVRSHGRGQTVPGAGIPVHPASPGKITVFWSDHGTSTITISDAVIGARARAHVDTTGGDGKTQVSYDATAFVDQAGNTEVDGRGAPVTGAKDYVPDSFRIHPDGEVEIEDDQGSRSNGRTDHAPTTPVPAPTPGPHAQKEL